MSQQHLFIVYTSISSSSGTYQQIEGPSEAKKLLEALEIDVYTIKRCCWLIAHHHTYSNIHELDHQILVEADFLVNIHEDGMTSTTIKGIKDKIFRTQTGIKLLETIFDC